MGNLLSNTVCVYSLYIKPVPCVPYRRCNDWGLRWDAAMVSAHAVKFVTALQIMGLHGDWSSHAFNRHAAHHRIRLKCPTARAGQGCSDGIYKWYKRFTPLQEKSVRRKHELAAPVTSESTGSEAPTAATAPVPVVPTALVAPVAAAAAAAVAGSGSAKPRAVKTAKAAPVMVEAFKPAVPDQTDTASKTADPIRERHADKDKDDKSAGKAKLVRDSFTMPRADFALIALLKDRALGFKRPAKKSELLRAGLHALAALDDATLQVALDGLAPVKAGRPKKG